MFRITEDLSSGSRVQCLAKNYKNDSIVSFDMDKVGVTWIINCLITIDARCKHEEKNVILTLYCSMTHLSGIVRGNGAVLC